MPATLHSPSPTARSHQSRSLIPAFLLWFAALGGTLAWALHELLAWSGMEIACQRREVGTGIYVYIGLVTGLPFLAAVASLAVALRLHRRSRRLAADDLTIGRTSLMLTVGVVLNLLALAAIVGDGIAIAVLEPC